MLRSTRVRRLGPGLTAVASVMSCIAAVQADERLDQVAERRSRPAIIVHRGAAEFAHENTLEAYRAALQLGADGSEIDIRATRDGVLICFHDDMLDHLLDAFGDAADHDWDVLRTFAFRRPGPYGADCRIPTLEETLLLHRTMGGLVHLDIKRPGLGDAIVELIDRLDMWPHIVAAPGENGAAVTSHPKFRGLSYKASLYDGHRDVDREAIGAAAVLPGGLLMVDDPRMAVLVLGRSHDPLSGAPVAPVPRTPVPQTPDRTASELLAILSDHQGADVPPQGDAAIAVQSAAIDRRARAAAEVLHRRIASPAICEALAECVVHRSLSPKWQDHGLDGAIALRALAAIDPPRFVELARMCVWRDDPAVEAVANPMWKNPRAWTDFRTKIIVFTLLAEHRQTDGAAICRDYLALSDADAERIGTLQFEQAARALLAIDPTTATALDLLQHRRSDVRGRAILDCVREHQHDWARAALEQAAPEALFLVFE